MFEFAYAGIAAGSNVAPISLSGSLSKTAAPSSTNVTSDTVTVTVPAGNAGYVNFISFSFSGAVNTQYSKNGGAFAAINENDALLFTTSDTLAVRGANMVAGESWTFTLTDNSSGAVIGTYTILAS